MAESEESIAMKKAINNLINNTAVLTAKVNQLVEKANKPIEVKLPPQQVVPPTPVVAPAPTPEPTVPVEPVKDEKTVSPASEKTIVVEGDKVEPLKTEEKAV